MNYSIKICWLFLSILALPVFSTAALAQPIEIRFAYSTTASSPKGMMVEKFKQLIQQQIGNDIVVIKTFPNSSLYKDDQLLDKVLNGKVEIAISPISKVSQYSSRFKVFEMPFIFASDQAAKNFLQGEYSKRLMKTLEPSGFQGFGFFNNGMRQLISNKPVSSPNDIKGMRISYQDSNIAKEWIDLNNAEPKEVSASQINDLIKNQQIDSQINTWSNILSEEYHAQQNYILVTNQSYSADVVLTSKRFWNQLPSRLKPIIRTAMQDALVYGNTLTEEKMIKDRQAVIDSKLIKISFMTANQRQQWAKAMLPVWKKHEDQIGTELIQVAAAQR